MSPTMPALAPVSHPEIDRLAARYHEADGHAHALRRIASLTGSDVDAHWAASARDEAADARQRLKLAIELAAGADMWTAGPGPMAAALVGCRRYVLAVDDDAADGDGLTLSITDPVGVAA